MVFAWRWIPKQIMGAHLTPHGVEATMLGLTAGTFNMAMILSSYCGGHLLHRYGIAPTGAAGEGHVFDDLWKVHVLAALSPCFMVFLLPARHPAPAPPPPPPLGPSRSAPLPPAALASVTPCPPPPTLAALDFVALRLLTLRTRCHAPVHLHACHGHAVSRG